MNIRNVLASIKIRRYVKKNSKYPGERGVIAPDNGRIDVNDFYVVGIPNDR